MTERARRVTRRARTQVALCERTIVSNQSSPTSSQRTSECTYGAVLPDKEVPNHFDRRDAGPDYDLQTRIISVCDRLKYIK